MEFDGSTKTAVPRERSLTAEENQEKWKIIKNVLFISLAFTFLFTSFTSMANLQSSLNKTSGTTSLSVLYAALVLSCAFVPTWLINILKVKWTIALSMLCYSLYIAAQFYPEPYFLLPSAILLGLGAAPMWSAKCTYLTQIGRKYASLVDEEPEVIITRFFGVFFLFFQASQVTGNLISSSVLSTGDVEINKTQEVLELCGPNFRSAAPTNQTLIESPDPFKVYLMSTIFLISALLSSAIIAVFVDPLERSKNLESKEITPIKPKEEPTALLIATFQHMKHPYQALIIPLTVWSGVEQAFIGADFTAAYVSCGLGVHMVGYIMICYGVCDAIFSLSFSPLVKFVGRVPIFTFGSFLNVTMIILMLVWMPNPDNLGLFFIVAALWGISDAIWQTQINALYGVLFPGKSEAAFSNYRLWESLGFIIAYVCSTILSVEEKLFLNLMSLFLGMAGYYVIECIEKRGGLTINRQGTVISLLEMIS